MQVTVEYLGQLGHLAGRGEETLEAAEGQGLAALLADAAERHGEEFRAIVLDDAGAPRPSLMVLVNEAPVDKARTPALNDGDRVTLLAAIAGG